MANTLKFGNGQWATKVGSTLAYNDEGGNFKPLPFNFTRSTGATRVNKDGLIEVVSNNKPRIDFLNDSNGALLLEPTRTNLLTYSEDFSGVGGWGGGGVNATANFGTAPDGKTTSSQVVFTGANQIFRKTVTLSGSIGVFSLWIKGTPGETIQLTYGGNTDKLVTLGSGWNRFNTDGNAATINEVFINTFSGATARTIEVWGGQVETNESYATSYIPTQGSIGTRVAESCSDAGNDQVINSTEGVLFIESSALSADVTNRYISIDDGTLNNYIYFRYVGASNAVIFRTTISGVVINTLTVVLDTTQNHKFAFKWKFGDYALWVDGVEIVTDTSVTIFPANTLNTIGFHSPDSTGDFSGNTKQIKYFNKALSDAELAALTKI